MKTPYIPPTYELNAFNCPHCHCYSHQNWAQAFMEGSSIVAGLKVAYCLHCKNSSLWMHNKLVYPKIIAVPLPSEDMPSDITDDYNEAANIVSESPRAAAALLRLSLQKLMPYLGQKGKNIDEDIAALVMDGLSPRIQQALDSLRVIGNNAVHPGKMEITDNKAIAISLFSTLNLVIEQTITHTRQIEELYGKLPESAVKSIEKRDGK